MQFTPLHSPTDTPTALFEVIGRLTYKVSEWKHTQRVHAFYTKIIHALNSLELRLN